MSAIEPRPTKHDLRVLRAVPECGDDPWRTRDRESALTIWQIAEILSTTDLEDLKRTLNGFMHLEYVFSGESRSRKRRVWWRTPKGDEAVAMSPGSLENESSSLRSNG